MRSVRQWRQLARRRRGAAPGTDAAGRREGLAVFSRLGEAYHGPPMAPGNAAVGGIVMRGLLGPIVIVSLLLLLVGVSPPWSYSSGWGYYPSGGIPLVLIVVFAFFAMRRI